MRELERPLDGGKGYTGLAIIILAASIGILALNTSYYYPYFADDSFISLRYSERLLSGAGLTFNDGEFVEGYSNLLWVLLVAGAGMITPDLVLGARAVGYACTVLTMLAIFYTYPPLRRVNLLASGSSMLALAGSGTVAVWTIGGLEQPLVMALLTWIVVILMFSPSPPSKGTFVIAGLLGGLLCLTRPDSPLLIAGIAAGMLIISGSDSRAIRAIIIFCMISALFYLGQTLFRYQYYHDLFPNTAYVKISPSLRHTLKAGYQVFRGLLSISPLLAAALFILYKFRDDSRLVKRSAALGLPIMLWLLYLLYVGGDTFPCFRHFMVVIPVVVLVLADGIRSLYVSGRPDLRRLVWVPVLLVIAFALSQPLIFRLTTPFMKNPLWEKHMTWEWEAKKIADDLRTGLGHLDPLMALTANGSLSYWSGFRVIDLLGLTDRTIARTKRAGHGNGLMLVGHENSNAEYVLGREPDLIIFSSPYGGLPVFPAGKQLYSSADFAKLYTLIELRAGCPDCVTSGIWVRRLSPRIGIRQEGGSLLVPGYLMNSYAHTFMALSPGGRLSAHADMKSPAGFTVELPAGRWSASLSQEGGPASLSLSMGDTALSQTFTLTAPSKIRARIDVTSNGTAYITSMSFIQFKD